MSGNGESFSNFSVYAGNDTWVTCYRYPEKTPILHVSAGQSALSVSVVGREATDAALEFARALLREAQAFAAEVERLHAANAVPGESADRAA